MLWMLCSQPEAPRPRRARRLLAGDRPPCHAVLEEPRRRPDWRRRLLDRGRGRVDPEGVHERGVRLQRQPDDHPLRVVGALGGAALPLVRVLVPAQRLRAEELALAVVAREHARRLPGSHGSRLGLRAAAASVAVAVADVGGAGLGGGGGGDREREVEADPAGGIGGLGVGRRLAADLGQLVARFLAHLLAVHLWLIATIFSLVSWILVSPALRHPSAHISKDVCARVWL